MKFVQKLAAAFSLAVLSSASFSTPVVIDSFATDSTPHPSGFFNGLVVNSANTTASQVNSGAGILGGHRKLSLNYTSGNANSQLSVIGGQLSYANDTNNISSGQVRWDGTSGAADAFGLNLDLTTGPTSIQLDVGFSDGLFGYEITLWNSATQYTTLKGVGIPAPAPQVFDYYLSWFLAGTAGGTIVSPLGPITSTSVGGGINLLDVDAITFKLIGTNPATDLTLDNVAAVSEPASLALVGLGLMGVGFIARRKRA